MKNNIRHEVIVWNNRFPLDRWFREKHKIPYLSAKHRESCFYTHYFEYHEDLVFKEYTDKKDDKTKYISMFNDWWTGKRSSKKEIDDWFNSPI